MFFTKKGLFRCSATRLPVVIRPVLALVAAFALVAAPGTEQPSVLALVAAQTAGDEPELLSVLVLGDSYSAGNGAGAYYDGACHRSPNNYGSVFGRLVESFDPEQRVFVETRACSDATTAAYWSTQHEDAGTPQRDWVNPGYDVVMMTFGGNDLGFKNIVTSCLINETADEGLCDLNLGIAEQAIADGSMRAALGAVLVDVLQNAGDAEVVLLGYPYLERDPKLRFGDVDLGERLRDLTDSGSRLQADLVAELAVDYGSRIIHAPTHRLFAGRERWLADDERGVRHELGKGDESPNRWMVQPFRDASLFATANWYHPNKIGWRRIGELLFRDSRIPTSDVPDPLTIRPGGLGAFTVGDHGHVLADAGYCLSCNGRRQDLCWELANSARDRSAWLVDVLPCR